MLPMLAFCKLCSEFMLTNLLLAQKHVRLIQMLRSYFKLHLSLTLFLSNLTKGEKSGMTISLSILLLLFLSGGH